MTDFDIDLLVKPHTVKINGKVHEFRELTLEDSMLYEFDAKEIENIPILTKDDVKEATKKLREYIQNIIDIDDEDVQKVTINQFKQIRRIMGRIDLYDQGFTDKEIDIMEKEMITSQFQGATSKRRKKR